MDTVEDRGAAVVRVEWGEFGWLRHGFSTRCGGVSVVYGDGAHGSLQTGSLNVGWTKEDGDEAVAENRRRLVRAVGGKGADGGGMRLVTVRQVHSSRVHVIRQGDGWLETEDGRAVLEGDGLMTEVPGLLLGVGTADCVPVLVADVRRRVVAAFHAGWRGTVERIVEVGVGMMKAVYGSCAEDMVASIGPSIGRCCYAVGEEVRSRFEGEFPYAGELFSGDGGLVGRTVYLDLWEANRRQLMDAGVAPERIAVVGACTACSRDEAGRRRYFSHRAERGVTGRMLSVVGIAGDRGGRKIELRGSGAG